MDRSMMVPCCEKAERRLSSTRPVPYTYTVFPFLTPLRSGYESDPERGKEREDKGEEKQFHYSILEFVF